MCAVETCNNKLLAKGLCDMHYRRMRRHGDPNYINPKCNRDGRYKERHKEYVKQWKKSNWSYYKAYLATRKKRVKLATPKWACLTVIEEFYLNCPKGFHVDHIVPLNGDIVSGLHTIDNLQYLAASENLKKSNKL